MILGAGIGFAGSIGSNESSHHTAVIMGIPSNYGAHAFMRFPHLIVFIFGKKSLMLLCVSFLIKTQFKFPGAENLCIGMFLQYQQIVVPCYQKIRFCFKSTA